MTGHHFEWLEDGSAAVGRSERWAAILAPIITAILVIALGATVFGLMAPDDSVDGSSAPVAVEGES
jgi:hypothetical protein